MNIRKRLLPLTLTLALLVGLGSLFALLGCAPNSLAETKLANVLKENNYTIFTPLRSTDLPGSVFVETSNHLGQHTEFTIATYNETFTDIAIPELFDPEGQPIDFADELGQGFEFDTSLGVELVKISVKPELAMKYVDDFKVTFGDPKRKYVMTLAKLNGVRTKLNPDVKAALRHYKANGQLNSVYLLLEVLEVEGLTVEVKVKDSFAGTVGLDKIKEIFDATAAVKTGSTSTYLLRRETPILIGFKAMAFPDTLLADEVSPLLVSEEEFERLQVPPQTLLELKK